MQYVIGVVLAIGVCVFARVSGFDRDRAFYPTVLIVVASYYILFAAMGSYGPVIAVETVAACGFAAMAVVGFRKSAWVVVAGLVGHGVFDFFHHFLVQNSGVPEWWPGFCLAFDALAGIFLGGLLLAENFAESAVRFRADVRQPF